MAEGLRNKTERKDIFVTHEPKITRICHFYFKVNAAAKPQAWGQMLTCRTLVDCVAKMKHKYPHAQVTTVERAWLVSVNERGLDQWTHLIMAQADKDMRAARIRDRDNIRSFSSISYVGNEEDEIDFLCAADHGTTGLKEWDCNNGEYRTIAVTYTNQGAFQVEADTVTLLIPDRDRPNQDDFIWCVPIERAKWNKWYALSEKFKTAVPKEHGGGVRYMNRMEGRNVKTVLVMPNEFQSDDDAVTACAFLRLVKNLNCRMYIVRCTDDPLTGARLIHKAAGADVTLVEDVEFEGDGTGAEAIT